MSTRTASMSPFSNAGSSPPGMAGSWADVPSEAATVARAAYEKKLIEYIQSRCLPPSSWELRQKNAELKFEAVDHFRKNSIGGRSSTSAVWKLERELAFIYDEMVNSSKQVRKASLGDLERFPCSTQLSCSCPQEETKGMAGSP